MRSRLAAFGALTGVLAIGLIIATLLPASSATTIRVYEKERQGFQKYINVDGKKSAAGDYILITRPLYRAGTSNKVGRDAVQITLIHPFHHDARFRAAATFRVGGGKLETEGSSTFSALPKGTATFAITGGTGAYNGASGTLVVHETRHRTHFTFNVSP